MRIAKLGTVVWMAVGVLAGVARADTRYQVQPIVKLGDRVSGLSIAADGDFEIGALNDNGQLIFVTENAGAPGSEMLLQYSDGTFTSIVAAGKDMPGGKWSQTVAIHSPLFVNAHGDVAFAAGAVVDNERHFENYVWEFQKQQVTPVARQGMPAADNRPFEWFGSSSPAINGRGEIAFVAGIKAADGEIRHALFFRDAGGKTQPLALPGGALPGGAVIDLAYWPTISDAGVVAFIATGDGAPGAYLWEKGTISPLAPAGLDAPDLGSVSSVDIAFLNNRNRNVLLVAEIGGVKGLYRLAEEKIRAVAVPGQPMPEGGKLEDLQSPGGNKAYAVSQANELGQHAFLATLEDGSTAAYQMDADGKLSLILKSGTKVEQGTVTDVGGETSFGIGLNSKGEVALAVRINDSVDTVVLLKPVRQ